MRYVTLALAALALAGCVVIKAPPDPGPNAVGGSLAGAGVGALIGAQIGAGSGNLAAIGTGAALGAMIGGSIGDSIDRANAAPYCGPSYGYAPPFDGYSPCY
jgi:uncharacterized protein YcfJ